MPFHFSATYTEALFSELRAIRNVFNGARGGSRRGITLTGHCKPGCMCPNRLDMQLIGRLGIVGHFKSDTMESIMAKLIGYATGSSAGQEVGRAGSKH